MTSSPGAGRVSQACRPCATARVKCDDSKPCKRCVRRELTCVYPEVVSSSSLHHAPTSSNVQATTSHRDIHPYLELCKTEPGQSSSPASHRSSAPVPSGNASGPDGYTSTSTPYSQTGSVRPGESQLLTPETVFDQQANDAAPHPSPFEPPIAIANSLPDVLYRQPVDQSKVAALEDTPVLGFWDNNSNLDVSDLGFGVWNYWDLGGATEGTIPPQACIDLQESSVDMNQMRKSLVKVWTESPWRWDPTCNDSAYQDQSHFAVPPNETTSAQFQNSRDRLERVVSEKLEQPSRDRVLAILLSQCRETATANQVSSSFPTVDVLDTLVHIFLAAQACQVDSWLHLPTLKLEKQCPHWIAMAAAHGGAMTPIPTLRRFGMAVMEAVQITIRSRFEENNSAIRNFGLMQSLILLQDLGLWSGNRRRMEIAESHLVIPVTMMRYRGRFQRAKYPMICVAPSDETEALEEKWKSWIEQEQWKRLVFHCYLREAQTSMTTLTNPCLSYSELRLPLPEARELWMAKTAQEWKTRYLERNAGQAKGPPSVGDLFHDVHLLTANHSRLDAQFSISILLHGFWALIWEYRQLSSLHKSRSYANSLGGNPDLLLSQRHAELVKDLQSLHLIAAGWQDMSAREHLLLHLLMMNLHVSIDDVQLFLGKEGEDEARGVYPSLQQWVSSTEARSAVWCASQVLRYAKLFPAGHLKDFYAVAVHHASVTLWVYGVVTRANRQRYVSTQRTAEPVYMDSADSIAIQRFIGLEHGRPVIRGPATAATASTAAAGGGAQEASLHDPRACMETSQDILRANYPPALEGLPPIVENLVQLIKKLGHAAWAVGLG